MKRFVMFLCVMVLSWVGWKIGIQFGLLTAWFVSGAGSLLGIYVGWKLGRRILE